jgi:hypothetical protein
MGMRDESWCNSCGTSVPYSDEDETYCGECASIDTIDTLRYFVEGRIKDLTEKRDESQLQGDYENDDYIAGAIDAYDIVRMKLSE